VLRLPPIRPCCLQEALVFAVLSKALTADVYLHPQNFGDLLWYPCRKSQCSDCMTSSQETFDGSFTDNINVGGDRPMCLIRNRQAGSNLLRRSCILCSPPDELCLTFGVFRPNFSIETTMWPMRRIDSWPRLPTRQPLDNSDLIWSEIWYTAFSISMQLLHAKHCTPQC
jgi:hypothetical protein